jgi:hypothetical protein
MKMHSDTLKQNDLTPKVRWAATYLISGLQGLLGHRSSDQPSRMQVAMREIRAAMLECLGQCGVDAKSVVHLRVAYANDIQDLWYLRGDVMAVIAANEGEMIAKKKLALISERFTGLLPRALTARNSPLND